MVLNGPKTVSGCLQVQEGDIALVTLKSQTNGYLCNQSIREQQQLLRLSRDSMCREILALAGLS